MLCNISHLLCCFAYLICKGLKFGVVRADPSYVIAKGGLSGLMYRESSSIDEVDKFIAINGLKILYGKNKDYHKLKQEI